MENTTVPTEVSQAALYFKPRTKLGVFSSPIDEDNPAGAWRDWVNPTTNEKGRTWELQLSKITGKWVDARINEQEWENPDGSKRATKDLLLALEDNGQTRVVQIPVNSKRGLSEFVSKFGRRCQNIDLDKTFTISQYKASSAGEYHTLVYSQDEGKRYPTAIKDSYWDKEQGKTVGLPAPKISESFDGKKQYDWTETNKVLYQNVLEFCEKVQSMSPQAEKQLDKAGELVEDPF